MAGYSRIVEEASRQWETRPDVVLVQGGVGGLVCAAAGWMADRYGSDSPFFICCEPVEAACLMESTRAGSPVEIRGNLNTRMEGLRCSEVSPLAWRSIIQTVDAFISIDDEDVFETMRLLARPAGADPPVIAGASGACGLAALRVVLNEPEFKSAAGLDPDSTVLVINTEGATDPALYRSVAAIDPDSIR